MIAWCLVCGVAQQSSGPWPQELKDRSVVEDGAEVEDGEEAKRQRCCGGREGDLPFWAKITVAAVLLFLLALVIGGGAAAPRQPWLANADVASKGYFSAGTLSAGVISCSSGLGMGFFSIGLVSFGVVGSIGIFSVGFFSIGRNSLKSHIVCDSLITEILRDLTLEIFQASSALGCFLWGMLP